MILAIMLGCGGAPVHAGESGASLPRLDIDVAFEIQNDNAVKSDDPDAEFSDIFNTTEAAIGLYLADFFSAHISLTFEPVLDPDPGKDRIIEDQGIFAEEAYGRFTFGILTVVAGKFNPAFGTAWDLAPGIYGADFAEDYELTERIGLGGSLDAKATMIGDLTLTAATYFTDTTRLSGSMLTKRGRTALVDGEASNTGDLRSFAVTADLATIPGIAGIALHLGYRRQAKGNSADDLAHEHGYVAGISGGHDLEHGLVLDWVAEIVFLDNANATLDELTYATLGATVTFDERYNIAISFTSRDSDNANGTRFHDRLFQASAGAEIHAGWSVDLGYRFSREESIKTHVIGVLIAKEFSFSTAN